MLTDPNTVRIKFDIIDYVNERAMHFGFVRFFALLTQRDEVTWDRKDAAAMLRREHTAAWKRYHQYVPKRS